MNLRSALRAAYIIRISGDGARLERSSPGENMSDHFGQGFEPGVGALLRASRLRFGQDLREVADLLRIRYPYLEAIEESRFNDLPGSAYAVGFVRTYAEYLGLDADEVVRRFKSETENMNRKTELVFPSPVAEQGTPSAAIVLVGLLVAGVAYGAWYLGTSKDGFLDELVSPVPEQLASALPGGGDTGAVETGGSPPGAADTVSRSRVEALTTPAQAASGPESPEPFAAETTSGSMVSAESEPTEPSSSEPSVATDIGVADPMPSPVVEKRVAAVGTPPSAAEPQEGAETIGPTAPADVAEAADEGPSAGRLSIPTAPVDIPPAESQLAAIPSAPAVDEASSATDRRDDAAEGQAPAGSLETTERSGIPDSVEARLPSVETTASAEPRETAAEAETSNPPARITAEVPAVSTRNAAVPDLRTQSEAVISATSAQVVTARASNLGEQGTLVEARPTRSAEPIAAIPLAPQVEEVDRERVGRVYGSASGTSRVEVRATTDSWIQVRDTESRRLLLTRLLRAGDSYLVPDRGGLTLLTGNAGALEIYVDGEAVAPIGPVGAVRRNVSLEATRLKEGTAVLD